MATPANAVGDRRTQLEQDVWAELATFSSSQEQHDAVALVSDAATAFAIRADSARSAGRSIDVQYYIWRGDVTGRLLAQEVLRAADRGVSVRLLLDDVYAPGRERMLAALDGHPQALSRKR